MAKFKLHWLDGKTEIVIGKIISEAFTLAGYGHGAVKALDFFEHEVSLSYIAHKRLRITTQVASHYLDGLADLPKFGDGLDISRAGSIHSWTMFSRDANEFVRRVEEYRENLRK